MGSVSEMPQESIHATTVQFGRGAVAILGPAGSGKSSTALELMSRGAVLVADDQTVVRRRGNRLLAFCPLQIQGRIEARNVGILKCEHIENVPLVLIVDLERGETERLPARRRYTLLGCEIDLIFGKLLTNLPAVILQYLKTSQAE